MRLPMLRTLDEFEKVFEQFFDRLRLPAARTLETGVAFIPDVEVIEREGELIVKVELPGVALEDVEVTMTGELLTIKGEKKVVKEEKKAGFYMAERVYGSFLRTIPVPLPVIAEKIEAKLEKGILEILLPKAEAAKAKKIPVAGETVPA